MTLDDALACRECNPFPQPQVGMYNSTASCDSACPTYYDRPIAVDTVAADRFRFKRHILELRTFCDLCYCINLWTS